MEAHRAKMASLLQEQQKEDSIAAGMPEWQPPAMASRPESATQKEDRVKTRNITITLNYKLIFSCTNCLMLILEFIFPYRKRWRNRKPEKMI